MTLASLRGQFVYKTMTARQWPMNIPTVTHVHLHTQANPQTYTHQLHQHQYKIESKLLHRYKNTECSL